MRDDHCAFFANIFVTGDVVEMVVGVDDELDGNLVSTRISPSRARAAGSLSKSVDDRNAVLADHKSSVGAGFALGIIDRGVGAVAKILK